MNRNDIIAMALEAGFEDWAVYGRLESKEDCLERFAALVAAAKAAEHQQTLALQQRSYEREIEIEVETEREACAKVCESKMPNPVQNWADAQIVNALRDCAEAIRARNT